MRRYGTKALKPMSKRSTATRSVRQTETD